VIAYQNNQHCFLIRQLSGKPDLTDQVFVVMFRKKISNGLITNQSRRRLMPISPMTTSLAMVFNVMLFKDLEESINMSKTVAAPPSIFLPLYLAFE